MNEQQLTTLIITAAANKPSGGHFRHAGDELLEQIMAISRTGSDLTAAPDWSEPHEPLYPEAGFDLSGEPAPTPVRATRWSARRRAVSGLAVAAAVAAAVAVPAFSLRGGSPVVVEVAPAATENGVPAPGLLLDDPAFSIGFAQGSVATRGRIQYVDGKRELDITWSPTAEYQGVLDDQREYGASWSVPVVGLTATEFHHDAQNFTAVLPPQGRTFYAISGVVSDRAAFDALLGRLTHVTQAEWDAAMPAGVVTPAREKKAAAELLDDVPLPPGFDRAALPTGQTNDRYQFSAHVLGQVACGWISDYLDADQAGDADRVARDRRALKGSHHWAGLKAMVDEGAYAQVLWEYADAVVSGSPVKPGTQVTVANSYRTALSCD